jgi:hypothetical protein
MFMRDTRTGMQQVTHQGESIARGSLLQPSPANTLTCCFVVVAARYCSLLSVCKKSFVEGEAAGISAGGLVWWVAAATALQGANTAAGQLARAERRWAICRLQPNAAVRRPRLILGLLRGWAKGD